MKTTWLVNAVSHAATCEMIAETFTDEAPADDDLRKAAAFHGVFPGRLVVFGCVKLADKGEPTGAVWDDGLTLVWLRDSAQRAEPLRSAPVEG